MHAKKLKMPGGEISVPCHKTAEQQQQNMPAVDREWVGRTLFVAKGKLTSLLKLWLHPPPVEYSSSPPKADIFHAKRLLLWLPRMLWKYNFHCQRCGEHESLRSKGLYNHVWIMIDVKDSYYVAGEYMDCRACSGMYITWDSRILGQLSDGVRARFPLLMAHQSFRCSSTSGISVCDWTSGTTYRRLLVDALPSLTHCMAPSCPTFLQPFLNGAGRTLSFYYQPRKQK